MKDYDYLGIKDMKVLHYCGTLMAYEAPADVLELTFANEEPIFIDTELFKTLVRFAVAVGFVEEGDLL